MPRYYCDYCDTYLTHDSPSVRKQHNSGYKHKANVRSYYEQFEKQQTQSLIDQKIKEHLGQTAAFQQVGAAYNQHLAAYPQRPRPPILPIPLMPNMGNSQMPPGLRPPVFPRPVGVPGYGTAPMPSMMSAPMQSAPMQVNGLPRPPTLGAPTATPGVTASSTSNGNPPVMYQPNPAAPTSGGFDSYNTNASPSVQMPPTNATSQDGYSYPQDSDNRH
ncbi:hypothetical protein AQUCO_00300916v1 [Aquilegia coerulea]|uniref:U1 small nuclear ribonucleoprotein C n=1 Tax=Aquilegia coerulea TaxID=218851 RepID=A0A2G5F135_AQUCA|nr:hypothetical protein AQUCO_01000508v1 [Aquilegia coerulea]PIA61708.1 hypothetical protein AQUCO_00300916v1 [Aquilegia coerulea]PIA61709.1 hypothetical protein AQUCO_00300916v1 [Aquilegia coerulea]